MFLLKSFIAFTVSILLFVPCYSQNLRGLDTKASRRLQGVPATVPQSAPAAPAVPQAAAATTQTAVVVPQAAPAAPAVVPQTAAAVPQAAAAAVPQAAAVAAVPQAASPGYTLIESVITRNFTHRP